MGFDNGGFVNDDANFAKSPAREKDKEVRLQVLLPVTCSKVFLHCVYQVGNESVSFNGNIFASRKKHESKLYANLPMAGSDKSEERRSGRSRQDTSPCLGDASRWNIAV